MIESINQDAGKTEEAGLNQREGELAQIFEAFNRSTESLIASHRALEERVAYLTGELARANRRIQQKNRLEAVGEMAAKVAHEIRNPLGGMQLYVGLLQRALAGQDKWQEWVKRIEAGLEAVNRVVGEMLDFSSAAPPRQMAVSLTRVISEAAALAALPETCQVRWRLGHRIDEMTGDPDLLCRIFLNLVRNAREAVKGQGVITIETEERPEEGGGVIIRVRDTGPGIAAEHKDRIFEPFFTTKDHGTGLGLPLVMAYVTAHGGQVSIKPAAEGACFEVCLPRHYQPDYELAPEVDSLMGRRSRDGAI